MRIITTILIIALLNAAASVAQDDDFAEFEEEDEFVPVGREASEDANAGPGLRVPAGSRESDKINDQQLPRTASDAHDTHEEPITPQVSEEEIDIDDEDDSNKQESASDDLKSSPEIPVTENKEGLRITPIPAHHLRHLAWDAYILEIVTLAGLLIYLLNFMAGRSKNSKLAASWLDENRPLLEANFALVGDDGRKRSIEPKSDAAESEEAESDTPEPGQGLVKETESHFVLWCSGRSSVDSLLVELNLAKRHDLLSIGINLLRPSNDILSLKFSLASDGMDSYVFCLANKKSATRLIKEMADISTYCPDRKSVDKFGLSDSTTASLVLMSEIHEAAAYLIDSKVVSTLNSLSPKYLEYIHISDQFSVKSSSPDSEPQLKLPEPKKVMNIVFNFSADNPKSSEDLRALLALSFHLLEKVRRFRLSKDGKAKAEKNRQKVEETFLKATHAARQEAAQAKREERRREERDRMLSDEMDPDRQSKWEEKEYKRDMKKKAPRMKQLKVK